MDEQNKMMKRFPCVVTGSRAYGPTNIFSDIDIVLRFEDAVKLQKWLSKHKIRTFQTEDQGDYGERGGFYFHVGSATQGFLLNIIICNDSEELESWNKATQELQNLGPIEDREERIDTFRGYLYE